MAARRRTKAEKLVWTQPEPARRPAPAPLSRERIVKAAIALADKHGLHAVSLRSVAAALEAGPMRLYAYTATKQGLLDLMLDAVYGELAAKGRLRGDWRTVLDAFAHRLRDAARRHQWFIALLGGRPLVGPKALALFESLLAAVHQSTGDIDLALDAVRTTTAWVVGALQTEASDLDAERSTGLDERGWQETTWQWLRAQLETEAFPTLRLVVQKAKHPTHDAIFQRGLECVFDGIAARISR